MEWKEMEQTMQKKYGFNCDYMAEGVHHASPANVLRPIREQWNELSDEEREHMCGAFSSIGGGFEVTNKKTEDGNNIMKIRAKTIKQLQYELAFDSVYQEDYKKYLEEHGDSMDTLDRILLREAIFQYEMQEKYGHEF